MAPLFRSSALSDNRRPFSQLQEQRSFLYSDSALNLKLFPDDARQAHRLRRFFLATGAAFMALFLFYLLHLLGLIPYEALRNTVAASLLFMLAFFALLRSGLNLRAPDPSLTLPMIVASSGIVLYVIHQAPACRPYLLIIYLVPFMFGLFRLNTTQMMGVAVLFLAGYGWVLSLDWQAGDAADELHPLILQWGVPAVVLCWFALFAGYVGALRKRLAQSNTSLEAALAKVRELVSHDELTGLHNRRYLMETLAREKGRADRTGASFSLLMVDLDRFKAINDNHGHAAGDEVLVCFARSVLPVLRPSDVLGRFGGEEFLLISPDTMIEGAQVLAQRIRHTTETMKVPGLAPDFRVTTSIGVAEYQPMEAVETTLLRGDTALYAAKQGGRNRVEAALLVPSRKTALSRDWVEARRS